MRDTFRQSILLKIKTINILTVNALNQPQVDRSGRISNFFIEDLVGFGDLRGSINLG